MLYQRDVGSRKIDKRFDRALANEFLNTLVHKHRWKGGMTQSSHATNFAALGATRVA
jgi:hypothetical protein